MGLLVLRSSVAGGGGLPPGVTLTEIDGGETYYADSGFTFATASFTCNSATYSAGWDDPAWFPIATFLDKYASSTHSDRWTELGLNTALAVQGDVNLSLMNTNGHQLIVTADEWLNDHSNNVYHCTLNANCPGIYLPDEPTTLTSEAGQTDAYDALETFPCSDTPPGNTGQTGRFTCTTFQHGQVSFFDIDGTDMDDVCASVRTTPCSTRTLGLVGVDQYFFNGAGAGPWPANANRIYNRSGDMSSDLMQRGVRYCDLAKFIREGNSNFSPAHPPFKASTAPTYVFVETGTSYAENTTEASAIRVAQMNAAVWGSIIGGCRFVAYFSNGDGGAWNTDSPVEDKAYWDTIYNSDPRSMYDQLTLTNGLVTSLAPVINSSNAVGYLTGMSPAEQPLTASLNESGYATLVKYYDRGGSADNKFYIFAIPRYGNRTHNNAGADTGAESWPKTATFEIADTDATQVTVINESRTISITTPGEFDDDFATRETVHIYRVD